MLVSRSLKCWLTVLCDDWWLSLNQAAGLAWNFVKLIMNKSSSLRVSFAVALLVSEQVDIWSIKKGPNILCLLLESWEDGEAFGFAGQVSCYSGAPEAGRATSQPQGALAGAESLEGGTSPGKALGMKRPRELTLWRGRRVELKGAWPFHSLQI
jgi:hypothetical protein